MGGKRGVWVLRLMLSNVMWIMATPAIAQVIGADRAHYVDWKNLDGGPSSEFRNRGIMVANDSTAWDAAMLSLMENDALLTVPARSSRDLSSTEGVNWRHDSVVLVTLGDLSG